ncbi:TraB/GumN family protein [Nanoarchaeota archaeon]
MSIKNLTIIGSSHIAKQSYENVERHVLDGNPDIIAVELDQGRLYSLLNQKKKGSAIEAIRQIGVTGYFFTLIAGWVQKKLGNLVGMQPGSEMLLAVNLAKKQKKKLALIDQDIRITMKRFTKTLTWREKFRFIGDLFRGIFFRKREMKKMGFDPKKLDLSKVPPKKIIKLMIKQIKVRYPNLHNVLIKERNEVMANNLVKIMEKNPNDKILAIMGAGHEDEVRRLVHLNMLIDKKSLGK